MAAQALPIWREDENEEDRIGNTKTTAPLS